MEAQHLSFSDYLVNVYMNSLQSHPWVVRFSADSDIPDQEVKFSIESQLVIGFGATKLNNKMSYISPEEIKEAWNELISRGMPRPRGLMFWNIDIEPDETEDPRNMATEFNKFLHTRPR